MVDRSDENEDEGETPPGAPALVHTAPGRSAPSTIATPPLTDSAALDDKRRVNAHDAIAARLSALPIWQGTPDFAPLPGGLSNLSFIATDRAGRYAVRLTRDFPFHNVSRDREVAVARFAHAAGFAPEIVHAAPGVMVSRWVDARPLTPADVAADPLRLAALIARFHREMMPAASAYRFDVFAVIRGYLPLLATAHPGEIAGWSALCDRLETAVPPQPEVFAHHDLLAANWLDDGTRLWLIDFEYAGRGSALFDLANLSSNADLPPADSARLLAAYYGETPGPALIAAHAAMEAASLLREALWALVSDIHITELDADYLGYARSLFVRLETALSRL